MAEPFDHGAPSVASNSLHLGSSLFEGIMAYWNTDHFYVFHAEEHYDRFLRGAAQMDMPLSWTVEQLVQATHALLAQLPRDTQYIRPIAYRGAPSVWMAKPKAGGVDVTILALQGDRYRNSTDSVACQISSVERISSRAIPGQIKVSGAYIDGFYARKLAVEAGFGEAIMLDREGRVAEATTANVFAIHDGRLSTPPLNPDVFPGITRLVVMELARAQGMDPREADLSPADLISADGVFLCSTLRELTPIGRLDQTVLRTADHPVFQSLRAAYRARTAQ